MKFVLLVVLTMSTSSSVQEHATSFITTSIKIKYTYESQFKLPGMKSAFVGIKG
jgi:hypothetical protein